MITATPSPLSRLAGQWWERALCCLLHCKVDGLKSWREEEGGGGGGGGRELKNHGIPGAMLAAILTVKIARYNIQATLFS